MGVNTQLESLLQERIPQPLPHTVKQMMEDTGRGFLDCKSEIMKRDKVIFKQKLLSILPELDSIEDLKGVIKLMLEEEL